MFGTIASMEVCVRDPSIGDATPRSGAGSSAVRAAGRGEHRDLQEVLAALGTRVAPTSMARERTLPTSPVFADVCGGGLVRGRVLSCTGTAATSVALGLIAPAVAAGSWVALIDVPTIGLDAARELGVPLERVVAIATTAPARDGIAEPDGTAERDGGRWADVVAAAADGFDVMVARVPPDVRAATVRKLSTRLQQRGVVMVVLGEPGLLGCDGTLDTACRDWTGLGAGWGHLRRRTVEVTATGRRLPGRRTRTFVLPAAPDEPVAEPVVEPVAEPVVESAAGSPTSEQVVARGTAGMAHAAPGELVAVGELSAAS